LTLSTPSLVCFKNEAYLGLIFGLLRFKMAPMYILPLGKKFTPTVIIRNQAGCKKMEQIQDLVILA
jgi:hypothetical protein